MEVTAYANPTSWNDKGMTWTDGMNAVCVDYAMALRQAIIERYIVAGASPRVEMNLFSAGFLMPIRHSFFVDVREHLLYLANNGRFVDLEFQDYKEDFSDAPKYWTYRDLNMIEECRICELPSPKCPAPEMIQWMIRAKNYLNKLTVCRGYMKYKTAYGDYTEHCTKFSTAYTEAKKQAMKNYTDMVAEATFIRADSAAFGSYENNVPVGEGDEEFCSTAGIRTIWNIQAPQDESVFKFSPCLMLVANTAINCGYPHEWTIMQKIVWDNGGFGINRGVTVRRFSGDTIDDITTSSIPTNTMKPKNKPACYYATSIGMWGTAYFLKDYGIPSGFQFRP